MEIIGHRGARAEAPENTLQSIQTALKAGVNMIEVDIRLQNDTLVLSHNPLEPNRSYTTLKEALEVIGTTPLNIEIKESATLSRLQDTIKNHPGPLLLSSFDYKTLLSCKLHIPNRPLAVLEKWSSIRAIHRAKKLGTQRIHMNQRWLWRGVISNMTKRGWSVYAYTVNSRRQAEIFRRAGLKGIFTDKPTLFMSYYKKSK